MPIRKKFEIESSNASEEDEDVACFIYDIQLSIFEWCEGKKRVRSIFSTPTFLYSCYVKYMPRYFELYTLLSRLYLPSLGNQHEVIICHYSYISFFLLYSEIFYVYNNVENTCKKLCMLWVLCTGNTCGTKIYFTYLGFGGGLLVVDCFLSRVPASIRHSLRRSSKLSVIHSHNYLSVPKRSSWQPAQ